MAFFREVPRSPLAGKLSQWYDNVQIVKDKMVVKVSEAEERLNIFDLARLRPITDGLDFFLQHCEASRGKVEAKVFDQVQVELTFLWLCIKAVKPKLVEDFLDMLLMGFLISRVDSHTDIQHVHKDGIHKVLEGSWGIGEAEGHYQPLIGSILSLKGSLPFITQGNLDKMVSMPKINLSIDLGLAW
ncbi:hypothetical protein M404DRAFT_167671 [Pisolithus tinctorius Marx 270]|uniref:Uncharacterized protein n=1 Tax=Pisolithus tinctorius Marx 270 TaxID=870435 RepID=A0A0C3IC67_PISTI|nr:hypothetical protein M404DRAFT_167671 [Pisolithus tinctorius Marx 270]